MLVLPYIFQSRTSQIGALNPLLVLFSILTSAENHKEIAFFNQTSLLRLLLIVVSHIVKIRKFKMLYFQNRRHYRAENFYKDSFFGPLQPGIHKNSEGLTILTMSQWKHSIEDTLLCLFLQASNLLLPVREHNYIWVYDPFSPNLCPRGEWKNMRLNDRD